MRPLLIFLLSVTVAYGFPTPIEAPKLSISQASKKVLEHYKKNYPKYKDPPFVIKAEYGSKEDLYRNDPFLKDQISKIKGSKDQMGWVITVLRYNDLSQSDTYFIDQNAKIEELYSTD